VAVVADVAAPNSDPDAAVTDAAACPALVAANSADVSASVADPAAAVADAAAASTLL